MFPPGGQMIQHRNAQTLYRHWLRLRAESPAPQQRALHPADIKELLPHLFVLQRFDPDHYVFRLAGTGYCALFGREFRTQNILALFQGPARKYLSVFFDRIVALPCGGIAETRAETLAGEHCLIEHVFLPIADADNRINRILGIANVTDWGTASVFDRFARQTLFALKVLDPAANTSPNDMPADTREPLRAVAE
ncbi:MAG: PAS domain-containing protein [Alphaproteobacteria bacterium]